MCLIVTDISFFKEKGVGFEAKPESFERRHSPKRKEQRTPNGERASDEFLFEAMQGEKSSTDEETDLYIKQRILKLLYMVNEEGGGITFFRKENQYHGYPSKTF